MSKVHKVSLEKIYSEQIIRNCRADDNFSLIWNPKKTNPLKNPLSFPFLLLAFLTACGQEAGIRQPPFTESFFEDSCTFLTTGRNPYFILEPGYFLDLRGMDGSDSVRLVITVLPETRVIDGVETRVLEEREVENGELVEISRNFVAFCKETGSVFYFGEEVDFYENGELSGHEGAWLAEEPNKPGILMPGTLLLGARFYQEIAPGKAMDRAEIVSLSDTLATPAGTFRNCLRVEESSALEPLAREFKIHAPGVGLVRDEDLLLVGYGYTNQ